MYRLDLLPLHLWSKTGIVTGNVYLSRDGRIIHETDCYDIEKVKEGLESLGFNVITKDKDANN